MVSSSLAFDVDNENDKQQKGCQDDDTSSDLVDDEDMGRGPYICHECSKEGKRVPRKGHECPFKPKFLHVEKKTRVVKFEQYSQTKGE
jgi:hypothetical protein